MSGGMTPLDSFLGHLANERRLSAYTLRNYRHAVLNFFSWVQKECGNGAKTEFTLEWLEGREFPRKLVATL